MNFAEEESSLFWKAFGTLNQGCRRALVRQQASRALDNLIDHHGLQLVYLAEGTAISAFAGRRPAKRV